VVDHIRFLKDRADKETKRLGIITEALHDIAKAHDIPVMALVQLNRDLTKRDIPRPTLADIRDSGEVEENADNVWFLHRPDYYDDSVPKTQASRTEFIVAKFRNGPADVKVNLDFNLKQEWFE
jgi:replicative DNA helicase